MSDVPVKDPGNIEAGIISATCFARVASVLQSYIDEDAEPKFQLQHIWVARGSLKIKSNLNVSHVSGERFVEMHDKIIEACKASGCEVGDVTFTDR